MRFCFLHGGLPEPLEAVGSSCRPRPGYLIPTDLGANTHVGIGGPGSWGPHRYEASKGDGMQTFVRAKSRPANASLWQLGR
jgi:hypothetical protein